MTDDKPFAVGDRVKLTPKLTGIVRRILGDQAEIEENALLGKRSIWRIDLAALRR
jgi:hypothetical protein